MYNRALVIGKFLPLHIGHLSLIEFACRQALDILICPLGHENESISLEQRVKWLKDSNLCGLVTIQGIAYNENELNSSSESDVQSSKEWSDFLRTKIDNFDEIDVIIGSEQYVKYMADYIGIDHIIYDEPRININISATQIKSDIIKYWDYLAPAVKRSYVEHICICGSESTGKSTTCKTLEDKYNYVTMIPEIGRCLVGKSELCSRETLRSIFQIHHRILKEVVYNPPTPIVLWDTDNITTLSYFSFLFPTDNKDFIILNADYKKANKYFFFESNVQFRDDNTRLAQAEALKLRKNHIKTYRENGVSLEFVNNTNRIEIVENYIKNKVDELITKFEKI
jgi:HTH-type transcriptional repressor of NAD biosynthesis genes